ncbi:hypothetical protein CK203_039385 [Vitis vinifera]|uniref:HAT C-terminal dimerisation domain-containing protein n=1 Tax=Vitis vinifera TaxID=29760 RepID=A0A438I789_VITVI|nr:hypothetical protein CK203_039385 [Vitis vinifera]
MTSEGGSALPGRDPTWKYCLPIEVHDKTKAKVKKNADIEDIRAQLRGTMGTHHTHLVDEDDDEDVESEDVYMYPADMHPDEWDAYQSAVRASKASEWEREQYENIVGSKRKMGESSQSTGLSPMMRKSHSMRHSQQSPPIAPSLYKSSAAKQKNIKDIFKGGAINETMGHLISKFFIYESVVPAKAKSHHFKNMIIGAQQAGMGIEPPSPFDIKNKYLEMEVQRNGSLYNGSAFMKAGKQLMKKYNLYWTPCAAHCIDLIFEDIGKRPSVIEVINNARKITNFIYNHGWLLAQMRLYCGGDIVRPGATSILLESKIQYRCGVGSDPELLQAVHDVFAKLDLTTESLGQFGNELVLFRDAKRGFDDRAAIAARSTMVPAEWWFMYGNQTPTLRKLAIKVLSQTASSTACERNWSTFALIHTKQRNRLAYSRLEQLVFCYYNMRLKLRDMETENDRVAEKDYLDLLDISAEVEVHSESFSKDTDDSHQEIDSTSASHSSRPSATGTSASGYDGSRGGTDDGGDNAGGDINERQHSQYPVSQFTCENTFTQDEDHGSRRAGPGIGAIGKPYRGRKRMMEPYNEELLSRSFESMSIGTQFSDSSNKANVYPPHVMSYGQPSSSTDEEYGMSRYSPSRQMPYQVPYQMEGGLGINTWVNFEYPIHVEAVGRTQEIYAWHVRIFNQYYRGSLSWYQYCLQQQDVVPSSINTIEPHRSSFWY